MEVNEKVDNRGKVQTESGGGKLSQLRSTVTIEPVLFMFGLGCTGLMPTLTALALRKVCLARFNGSLEICDHLSNETHADEENEVQTETAMWLFRLNLCYEIPSIVSCFFYGSVSDNVSRKLALLIPAIGQIFSCTSHLLQAIYMDLPVAGMLIGPCISGSCGGWISSNMASYSYLGDVTSEKKRTFRIAVGEAITTFGVCGGFLLFGVLLDKTSLVFCFALILSGFVVTLLYVIVWIKEPEQDRRVFCSKKACQNICTLKKLKDMFSCVFKRRKNNKRLYILTCFAILTLGIVGSVSPLILNYLYVRKQPMSWSNTLFGVYLGYSLALGAIGAVAVLPLLQNRLHLRETTVLLMAEMSTAACCTMIAFSVHTWMMFLASLCALLAFCQFPILRSLLSKLVEKNELGRTFAMFGSLQSVSGMAANTLYNNVYAFTLHIWAGLSFMLGTCLLIFPAALTVLLRYWLNKSELVEEPSSGEQRTANRMTTGDDVEPTERRELEPLKRSTDIPETEFLSC